MNFGYHFARTQGAIARRAYHRSLPMIVRRKITPPAQVPFEVYAYSGEAALPEQVASLQSLLQYAGRPTKFTVVSDGSYTPRSIDLLKAIDPCVSVAAVSEWLPTDAGGKFREYLSEHPTGKQLGLIMSLPAEGPALYIDSDVLFFPAAGDLLRALHADDVPALYLADCQLSADERLLRSEEEREHPVNTGVLFLGRKLDWSAGISRFDELESAPTFFTNQTITHLVMHANGAQPLDAREFVLQLDDQFIYRDRYAGPAIALRHYVNPVRHKFWTSLAR